MSLNLTDTGRSDLRNKAEYRKDFQSMKREEIKNQIPNITDEQLQWVMDEYGKGITAEQKKAAILQSQVQGLTTQLQTAQDSLKTFEGVDVNDLKGQITKLQNDLTAQASEFNFNNALDGAIRDLKGKNVKAIRGMLEIDTLKQSKNQNEDIKNALVKLKAENAWAFETEENPQRNSTKMTANTGSNGTGNNTGSDDVSGVEQAFRRLNPEIKNW